MKVTKWQLIGVFFKEHFAMFLATFVTGLVFNIFTLLIPIAIGKFYELNFNLSSKKLRILESFDFLNGNNFNHFLYLFIGLVTCRFLLEFANRYFIGYMGERFSKELREKLFAHQLHVAYPIYEEKGIGKYLLRFSGDLKGVQNYLTRGILRFSQDIVLLIILMVVIAIISPVFALTILGFGLIISVLLWFLNKQLFIISSLRRNKRSGLLSFVNTRLRAILSLKVFNKFSPELKRYNKRSTSIYQIGLQYQRIVSFIYAIVPAFTYLLIALLMALIYYSINSDAILDPSSLLVLILIIISFLPVIRRILKVSVVWKLGNISFAKLIRILSLERENLSTITTKEINLDKIEFSAVNFSYPQSTDKIFDNLSFKLSGTGVIAICGEPGNGKTTLIKLILALYKPTTGTITYGNADQIQDELSIRRNIAVVSDMMPLYGRTVYEAVVYSRNKQRQARAQKLLTELQSHEQARIKLLLEDKIGELGVTLTTGQRKILMYIRALLTNKPILIVENPFAGLSEATEQLIKEKLHRLAKKKLVVLINKTTIDYAKIKARYKLADGKISKCS